MDMRKLTLTFLAGAGALIASSAYAADEIQIGDSSPLLHQARLVCNDAGQCWNTRSDRRVIIGDNYYAPRLTESEGRGPLSLRINYFADSRLAREVLT